MKNQLFLSCSLYPKEIEINLYQDNPLFKANYIQDDLIIYEDAQYNGRLKIYDTRKEINQIFILLNGKEIGFIVNLCKNDGYIYGDIKFYNDEKEIFQPFLLQYNLIEICIKIIYLDNTVNQLYTNYLVCVNKNKEDTENIKNILKELLEYDNDKISKYIFQKENTLEKQDGLLEGSLRHKSYKSILSYLNLLEKIIYYYRESFIYFRSSPKHSIITSYEMKRYVEMRKFTQRDFNWLIQNLEQLSACNIHTNIEYKGDYYLPLNILSEIRKLNYDIYENRVIISFLKYLISDMHKLKKELKKAIFDEESIYKKLIKFEMNGYSSPIITIKKIQNKYIEGILEKNEKLIKILEQTFQLYYKYLPVKLIKFNKIPKKTKIFQEIKQYRIIYDMIVKWFEFGEIGLEKDKIIFRVKTIDKLFEYYSLQQIIKMFLEQDFIIENPRRDIKFFNYSVDDILYENEKDVANTYIFKKDNISVKLYYQPVIFSDGYQNGISLYRTTMTYNSKYYTPDFVIEFSDKNRKQYVIFDSKYSNRKNIVKYYLKECIMKYGVEIETLDKESDIRMVWILQGRIDEESYLYNYNNSKNAINANNAKSYGVVSLNAKINIRQILWEKIKKNLF